MQVPNRPTRYIVGGSWLGHCMFVQPRDGGKSPLMVLEGEGKPGCWLTPPRLGAGVFSWPAPLKFFLTSLHLLSPRWAITCSPCLHRSRWEGGGNRSFRWGLLSRSLHG